jgi:hypothetical protein
MIPKEREQTPREPLRAAANQLAKGTNSQVRFARRAVPEIGTAAAAQRSLLLELDVRANTITSDPFRYRTLTSVQ